MYINSEVVEKLEKLFDKFIRQESASSFAVNDLFNKTISIIAKNQGKDKGNSEVK